MSKEQTLEVMSQVEAYKGKDWLAKEADTKKWTVTTEGDLYFYRETVKAVEVGFLHDPISNAMSIHWIPKSALRLSMHGQFLILEIATWLVMKNGWFNKREGRCLTYSH